MTFYNRNGILYTRVNGRRISTKLEYSKENIKVFKNHIEKEEFFKKFNINTKKRTILEFCEEILEEKNKKLQPTTMNSYYSLFRSQIIPFFKNKYPNEIEPKHLKEWYYATFKSKSSLNTCVNGILKPAFENAIIEGDIKTTPFIINFPTFKSDYEINPFTLKEIDLILSQKEYFLRNFLGVAFFTGARTGEILALEWSDINFNDKTININKTRTSGITKQPKTKSSVRIIDMLPQCEIFLKEQMSTTGSKRNVFLRKNNELFNGSSDLGKNWYKLLESLNLEKRNIYQTRHSFASNMLSNNESLLWVSQMLGHKSLNLTLDIYTKYIKEERTKRKTTFLDKSTFSFTQK